MKTKSLITSLKWISAVTKRFSRVDRTGRSAVTSMLATLGIGFGVMTLIVVMGVMNGFQMSFIDSILEISSYHARVTDFTEAEEKDLIELCRNQKKLETFSFFYEAQALMTGNKGGANSVLIRAIDKNVYVEDAGFKNEVLMLNGKFELEESDSIVLGSTLAKNMGVKTGDTVNLLVMSGGNDVELFSRDRVFTVTGVFSCGYQEINAGYAFVNIEEAEEKFGQYCKKNLGVKLKNYSDDMRFVSQMNKLLVSAGSNAKVHSWREYNKSFFGTLRIEKNILLLLVALIFVVVAINIYNGMRRLVFERKSEIAILSALGARNWEIKSVFIFRGAMTGLAGAVLGLFLGILITLNTDVVFNAAAKIMYLGQYVFTAITDKQNLIYVQENSSYSIYANIPARIFPGEVAAITIFGIIAPLFASWAASKNVLKMTVSEVLHNE